MAEKIFPLSKERLEKIISEYPTPFHIYDEAAIRENARRLNEAFAWNKGFKEYFAVKATPNPRILDIIKEESFGADCSSQAELILSERAGIVGEDIMFTSNDTPASEYQKAKELGAIINLDDISHIAYLEEHVGLPDLVCFRYNPGPSRSGNDIIGKPEEAKYGFTKKQLFEGYKLLMDKGVKRFGLHTMVCSNELDRKYFLETVNMLFDVIAELKAELGITFEFINIGGGIGIPYRPEEEPVDLAALGAEIKTVYDKRLAEIEHPEIKVLMECGRMVTGPFGYLVSRVIHKKETYRSYVGLDACMANLMRPGMYGAYHHVSVVGKEKEPLEHVYDVVGSLCENNDKFAINRRLPEIHRGDLVIIHDAGAHGHSMGFNYNGKLRSAELLLRSDGEVELIRRAETYEDHFATLRF